MTLNSLLEEIPKDKWDYFLVVFSPILRDGDDQVEPLIQVDIDDDKKQILLQGDFS